MRLSDHPSHLGGIGYYARTPYLNDDRGLFHICRAVPVTSSVRGEGRVRCDSGAFGPVGMHDWDDDAQRCSCGRLDRPDAGTRHHAYTLANISWVNVLADALPFGFVTYLEAPADVLAQAATETDCARTLPELFRLMWEWSQAYRLLGNREPIAEMCHGFLEAHDLPLAVEVWLVNCVPEQAVAKYLRGDQRARARSDGAPDMGEAFDRWVTRMAERAVALGDVRA